MQGTVSKSTGLFLTDILQLLCQTGQTGCLHLVNRDERVPATINLSAGGILNVRFGDKLDSEALTEILHRTEWEFEMAPEIEDAEARMQDSLSTLLMQSSIAIDHVNGNSPLVSNNSGEHREWRPQLLEYVLEKGHEARGGFSEEDARVLAEDLDFFQTAAHLLASRLGETAVRELGVTEPGQAMAFAFASEQTYAVVGVNADLETTIARVRSLGGS